MYRRGDQVVYGIHGVCSVLDIETKVLDRKSVEYYVLAPNDQPGARFYVPIHNAVAVSKMKQILTRSELDTLLRSEEIKKDVWISDDNQRKQRYRELIGSADRVELLQMIHTLLKKKNELLLSGKKFHQCDENFLRDAKKILNSEICHVLDLGQKDVETYISSFIDG